MKAITTTLALSLALSGCFIVSKPAPTSSRAQPSTAQPKNYGQQRSQEAHERNAERKAEKGK
jgi:hypothetical protein